MKKLYNELMGASLDLSEVCYSITKNGIDYTDPTTQKTNRQLLTEKCGSVQAYVGLLQEDKVLDSIALCKSEMRTWSEQFL